LIRQRSILIVEDDHELRRMFRHALGLAGYAVNDTSDGIQALRIIEQHRPDLIVLDLGLPMLSGLDVQAEIAAHAQTRDILVVVVTGSSARLDGLAVECILRKPVSPDDVVAVVKCCFAAHAKRDTA
jgi:two-component system KDP operon response regulator KdpE